MNKYLYIYIYIYIYIKYILDNNKQFRSDGIPGNNPAAKRVDPFTVKTNKHISVSYIN